MKRASHLMFALLLMLGLAACGAPAAPPEPLPASTEATTPQPKAEPTPEPAVVFTDAVLEELVRKAMNKPEGDITLAEAETVTALDLQMEGGVPIPRVADVSDLAQFPNLTNLNLNWALYNDGNAFDISPLAALTQLECLYVCCDDIADISALSGMTNMKDLWIWGNKISDISALEGMTQMQSIWIKGNQITDISALSGMKNLVYLCMEDNQVTDLLPLAGLSQLKTVQLSGNPASDYTPLKDVYPNLDGKDFEL